MSDHTDVKSPTPASETLLAIASGVVVQFRTNPDLDTAVIHALGSYGEGTGIGRCYVLQEKLAQSGGDVHLEVTQEWKADQLVPAASVLTSVRVPREFLDQVPTEDHDARGITPQTIAEYSVALASFLGSEGAQSVLVSPVSVNGERWGFLVAESGAGARNWTGSETNVLSLIANALGAAIEQRQTEIERARIAAIFENSEDAIISKTLEGIVTDWNGAAERIYGYSRDEMLGQSLERIVPAAQREELGEILARLKAGERIEHHETTRVRKDGRHLAISLSISPLYDQLGETVGAVTIARDVTQRKAAEVTLLTQLQRAHAEADAESTRLRELFQHAPSMMALLEGPEHRFVLANDHYLRSVGNRDVLGRPVAEALPEIVDQGVIELLDQVYQTGVTVTRSELPLLVDMLGDGVLDQRYFSFAYQPFREKTGQVSGILVQAIDLTDQVRARQRLEKLAKETASERDRLQQIIDVLPEGVAISDEHGEFLIVNSAALEIWGQPPPTGGVDGYVAFECFSADGTRYASEDLPLSRSIRNGEVILGEQLTIRNVARDELIPVLINSAPLLNIDRSIIGGMVVFQDISGLKEFERQKDEFLQAVSHDLKNPLTTILGNVQLLRRIQSDDHERVDSSFSNIESASKRAIALVDEILDLTRLQMGRPIEMSVSSVNLVDLLHELAEQHQVMTHQHTILVRTDTERVDGFWDRVRLERVFANLLSNAIVYSPNGGQVTTSISLDNEDVIIKVQDQGLGIPKRDMSRLFDRFWRGSNVRDLFPGTGLGLAGAKAIVEAHGGVITAESVEGEGSTFTVRLPIECAEHRVPD